MIIRNLWEKLRIKKNRDEFAAAQLLRGVPFQIRAMRKKLGWSQETLAKKCGLTQGAISRAENPDYGLLSFSTVLAIAKGFDVAFEGRFVSFGTLVEHFENLGDVDVQVPTFEEEDAERRRRGGERQRLESEGFRVSGISPVSSRQGARVIGDTLSAPV